MSHAALFLANGFEEMEAIITIDVLRRGDIDVAVVSITRDQEVIGAHKIVVKADLLIEDFNPGDIDLFILPGGMPGSEHLADHDQLRDILNSAVERKKTMAAICAAPLVFGRMGVLKGEKAICYPGFEKELKGAIVQNRPVVESGQFITSKGPGTAFEFALKLVERFKGRDLRDLLVQKMQLDLD